MGTPPQILTIVGSLQSSSKSILPLPRPLQTQPSLLFPVPPSPAMGAIKLLLLTCLALAFLHSAHAAGDSFWGGSCGGVADRGEILWPILNLRYHQRKLPQKSSRGEQDQERTWRYHQRSSREHLWPVPALPNLLDPAGARHRRRDRRHRLRLHLPPLLRPLQVLRGSQGWRVEERRKAKTIILRKK